MNAIVDRFAADARWVNWRYVERDGMRTKVPFQPDGRPADTTNPATWHTLPAVCAPRGFNGFGFVFAGDMLGIDLDGVLDAHGNITDPASATLVDAANSYTEVTPSKRGLHVFLALSEPLTLARNRSGRYECYERNRYFTMTGVSLGEPHHLRSVDAAAALRVLALIGYPWMPQPASAAVVPGAFADESLIAKISKSHQGGKFARLMNGVITGYPSDSEADAALCAIVAWWTKDETQIERIWALSGLANRDKFQREDYRRRTIKHALAKVTGEYLPRPAPASGRPNGGPYGRQPQHVSQDAFARILERVRAHHG
jgi:putative DNA primase/helicase